MVWCLMESMLYIRTENIPLVSSFNFFIRRVLHSLELGALSEQNLLRVHHLGGAHLATDSHHIYLDHASLLLR